ncbi:MAG: ketoacyl-ACP synthase III [Planctomycetaceae bacterium]|jgi:3-oxoacyl-[acyl-carrier-protein] synthase-3|nr:ketoacyl-ACP synthase III [Planctomycetaceae bacterium]
MIPTRTSVLKAIVHALPEKKLINEEIEKRFTQPEVKSFLKMSGIRKRHIVAENQTASDLAVAAAKKIFETTNIAPASIDLLTFCSLTPDFRMPATACSLQHRIGLSENCCTFDIIQACPAFIHNLAVVHGLLVSKTAKRALALNADAITRLIHPKDYSLTSLHGDAAVAVVMEASETNKNEGIEWFEFGTDGSQWERLSIVGGMARQPYQTNPVVQDDYDDENHMVLSPYYLKMDGTAVFHFAVHKIPVFVRNSLEKHRTKIEDYDLVLLHQANRLLVDMIYKILKVPQESRFYYLEDVGNLSGVSLPAVLSEALAQGKIRPGSKTLLCGFGAGLSWGAVSIRWSDPLSLDILGGIDVP